jgi:predicted RND superfamily exporter protein
MKRTFFARRRFTIVLAMMFILPFIGIGTRRALRSNVNNVKDWLPDGFKETAQHSWFQQHFPLEQFVLISWEGCTMSDQRLELFARKLVPTDRELAGAETSRPALASASGSGSTREGAGQTVDAPLFNTVLTGPRLVADMQARYPELTEEEILGRLKGSLIGDDGRSTCLVVTLTEAAKGKNLRPTLGEIRRIASEECNIPDDEIRLGGPPVDNVAIDVEGERTLFRLAGLSAVVGFGISMLCFRSMRLTWIVFWIALLCAGLALTFVAAVGLFFPGSSYGTCDAVLLSMPSLVYVLAISGAIHIVNYYHDSAKSNGLEGAVELGVQHALRPCTIAAATTALGLGSLVISNIIPISKFGMYSALGVLAGLFLLYLYLPALLHYFPSRKYSEQHRGGHAETDKDNVFIRWWRMVGGVVVRHNGLVAAGCIAVMIFFIVGVCRINVSVKLMKLFSPDAEIIAHYSWLEDQLGPLVPMEVVLRFNNEENDLSIVDRMRLVQYMEGTIEKELAGDVGGALSAATIAPNIRPDSRKTGVGASMFGINRKRTRDYVLNKRLEQHRSEFREYLTVDVDRLLTDDPTLDQLRIRGQLAEKLEASGLTKLSAIEQNGDLTSVQGLTSEDLVDVGAKIELWRAARNPSLEQLELPEETAEHLAARGLSTLEALEGYGLDEIEHIDGIGEDQVEQIAAAISDWRTSHGDELWRVSARVRALSDLDYGLFVDDLKEKVEPVLAGWSEKGVEGLDAVYTGLVPLIYKTQHELFRGLFESLMLAFALIAVVMICVLRSPSAGLLAMIPNLFPVVVIFGIMGWTGILVDIGSMMTASVALGVAVDDTVHYLTWYRFGLDKGLNRKGAVMLAYERCATAMTQTTLIGGFGLAVFAFSTFTPTQRFGMLMLTLLFAALVGDLIFLPAMLTGPVGRLFRGRRKTPPSEPTGTGQVAESADEVQECQEVDLVTAAGDASGPEPHLRSDSSHRSRRA